MNQIVDGVLAIVSGLKQKGCREFFSQLIASEVLTKDEEDILIIESPREAPSRLLDEFIEEMKKKGRLS
jgi:muramoyltetrapeptide carboxypeptidase LdcA involved in peptidoglycan recycling